MTAKEMAARAMRSYDTKGERSALRCALGDAAAVCDALAETIKTEHRGKHGRTLKRGHDLAAIAKRAGDEIWAMRSLITHEQTDSEAQPQAEHTS